MTSDVAEATPSERVLALAAVLAIAAVTFLLARWLGRRLKGWTRLGLHGLERLAAPVTLFAIAASAWLFMEPTVIDPDVLTFAVELVIGFGVFWFVARSLDVFWQTGESSARLRHNPAARSGLMSVRLVGKVLTWIAALIALAVKLGADRELYLVLGGLGAALAFAARDPIRNALAFGNMLVDPPFRLGDRVRLEEFRGGVAAEGRVLAISLSAVTIETTQRTRVVVSNLRIGELRVENLSVADRRRLELSVPIPPDIETEKLRAACDTLEADLEQHPRVSRLRAPHVWISGAPGGLQLKASLWLRKASSRRETQRDVLLRIRERLEARAISAG